VLIFFLREREREEVSSSLPTQKKSTPYFIIALPNKRGGYYKVFLLSIVQWAVAKKVQERMKVRFDGDDDMRREREREREREILLLLLTHQ